MLNLTRRIGEQVYIYPGDLPENMTVKELFEGGQISIEILGVQGSQVRIGIDAPKNLTILRDDVK